MDAKIIRIITEDSIELAGIFYEVKNSNKTVIHVHGLSGNFYENKFLDKMAVKYNNLGWSFLVFNNRGSGIVTNISNHLVGSAFEIFDDSKKDIDAAVKYVIDKGYNEIVLQGHSFGCNKVINYANNLIKGIILLAPTDVVYLVMQTPNYDLKMEECRNIIEIEPNTLLNGFNQYFSAKTIVENFIIDGKADIFRYRDLSFKCSKLNNLKIPVVVFIGDKDNLALTHQKEEINHFFYENVTDIEVLFVDDADHSFRGYEEVIASNCEYFIADKFQ